MLLHSFTPAALERDARGTRFALRPAMSHKCVEAVIGKLATDEGFRRRFLEDAVGALDEVRKLGVELTPVEVQALAAMDQDVIRSFASGIDQRLQKVDLTSNGKGD